MSTYWDGFKEKFSVLKEHAGKFAKVAIDKTTNAVDITKLNLAKSEADGKINKLYAKIGETLYKQYKDGAEFDDEIAEIMVEIDKFKAESDELKEQIAALKSNAVCPKCGTQNDKASDFCSKCGAKLKKDEEKIEELKEEKATVDVVSEEK